ncbi:hypothetical protein CB1_000843015 [Camelus ferus]|nr:hypothetical protein CB1_000843015 [Camelus ferus]
MGPLLLSSKGTNAPGKNGQLLTNQGVSSSGKSLAVELEMPALGLQVCNGWDGDLRSLKLVCPGECVRGGGHRSRPTSGSRASFGEDAGPQDKGQRRVGSGLLLTDAYPGPHGPVSETAEHAVQPLLQNQHPSRIPPAEDPPRIPTGQLDLGLGCHIVTPKTKGLKSPLVF